MGTAIAVVALAGPAGADHCGLVQLGGCDHPQEPSDPEPRPDPGPSEEPAPSDPGDDSQPAGEPAPAAPEASAAPGPASELLQLLNQERLAHGLAPLASRGDVTSIAQDHSLRMARAEAIFHNDEYFSAATKEEIGAARRAENVAMSGSAGQAHRRLMDSPPHRANILDPGLTQVGLAAAADESGFLYFTQAFLVPVSRSGGTASPVAASTTPDRGDPSPPTSASAEARVREPAVLALPDDAPAETTSRPSGVLPAAGAVGAPDPLPTAAVLGLAIFALVTATVIRSVSGWAVDPRVTGRAVPS